MNRLLQVCLLMLSMLFSSLFAQSKTRPIAFEDMFAMGRVADPHISPDGRWVAFVVTTYDIEKNRGNSDIHLVSVDGKEHRQLTYAPGGDFHPRWAPEGNRLAFISTRNGSPQIYLLDLEHGGEARQLTHLPTGVNSFAWSPDGKFVAVETEMYPDAATPEETARRDKEREKSKVKARLIDHLLYRHWNRWREGKYNHVLVVPVDGGTAVDVTPGAYDTPPISLGSAHDYVWSPDGQEICFVRNADPIVAVSTNNDLWVTSPGGGEIKQITTNPANDNGPRYSPDGRYIAFMAMKRAGFESDQQDLMLYDRKTGQFKNLTETLDRYVSEFVWAPDGRSLYFVVPHHGRYRLYRVRLGKNRLELLLEGHYLTALDVAPSGKFLILARQAVNQPTELYRFDLRSRKLRQITHINSKRLAELAMNPLEDYWFIGANNDSVHLLMVRPPHFDPNKKYPLLCLIHGGPQGAWGDDFHYRWNAEMFASPGYVVIMINFHGSRGYGQAFCDAVSHNWGGWPYEDIMKGTRWAIDHFDFIDPQRVGAAGASYGGFMINWIEGHNDEGLFKVLVCHDGVFEQVSMFGSTEELWFPIWEFNGRPWDKGSLYQKWNPVNYVKHFKTPMLIVHGENDFRVPYTQGLQVFTALQLMGVDSKLLYFPDEDHFVTRPQNARLWWATVHKWLARYLNP